MRFLLAVIFYLISVSGFSQVGYEWVVNPQYYRAFNFSNDYARVFQNGKGNGFVNKDGILTIPIKYWAVEDFHGKFIFLSMGMFNRNTFSLFDGNRVKIIPDFFTYASTFSEGLAIVKKDRSPYAINEKGVKVFSLPDGLNDAFFQAYANNMASFYVGDLGRENWGAINNKGDIIVKPKYKYVSDFSNGVAAFQSGSYWGVIDNQGQVVLAPKYNWINTFSEGIAVVRQGKQHGYIDVMGEKVIPVMYKQAHGFSEGLAAVENDAGLWGFIDKNNHYVLRPQFTQAFSFHDGLARVENKFGKIGYIDKSGKLVIDYQFEDGRDLSEGMIAIKQGGKWGYIKILNPPQVDIEPNTLFVEPASVQDKKLKYGKGILVSGVSIDLEVFDFENEDGDSISLFFNGKPVLENYLLKNIPVKLKIQLEDNQENQLVLHAHNLGKEPPNTAAIKILDSKGKVQQVEMISDLKTSDVLYFFKKQEEVSGQVNYTITYSDVGKKFKMFVEKLPKEEVLFFKGNRLHKNINNTTFMYDNSLKKSYLCKVEQGQKIAYFKPLNEKVDFKLVAEKYNILDYVCRKAIITKKGVQTDVYYTTELPFEYSPFEGVPGVVLQYSEKTRLGMKTVTANSVAFSDLSDTLFRIEGYELKSFAEMQKQKMKEMRAIIDARKKGEQDAKAMLLNKPAPKAEFNFLDGSTKLLSDFREKVVVLNFWFVECMPCKMEMPELNNVVDSFKNKDVVFISIAKNKAEDVQSFFKKSTFKYKPSIGKGHFDLFGIKTFPTTVIIDKKGEIIYFSSGLKKNIKNDLIDIISTALK